MAKRAGLDAAQDGVDVEEAVVDLVSRGSGRSGFRRSTSGRRGGQPRAGARLCRGFAGLFDATGLKGYRQPVLATSTDGVGTKVAVASAMGVYDTIGADLVGMLVDDLVVVGAEPLFVTDYIACGHVVPERIAAIVAGVASACRAAGAALSGRTSIC